MEYHASSLTTNIDVATAQYFDGSLNSFGRQTLQNFDELTGQKIFNELDAEIIQDVTPAVLDNIQLIEISNLSATGAAHSISLLNANAVEAVVNDGSLGNLTFNQVGSTLEVVGVESTDNATTVNFSSTAGVTELDLALVAAGSGDLTRADVTIADVETVNVFAEEADSYVNLSLADATSLTVAGDADLSVRLAAATNNVSSIDATSLEGDLDLIVTAQTGVLSTTDISVTSGQGDDTIDVSAVTQDYIITLGAGNDTVTDLNVSGNDTIIGGEGVDTLATSSAAALALTSVNGIEGIDILQINDTLTNSLNSQTIDTAITEVDLNNALGSLNDAAVTITGGAGSFRVDLGTDVTVANRSLLGGNLTVADTGSASTDALTINNYSQVGALQQNVFNGNNVTSTGYENVTVNTGDASPYAVAGVIQNQTIGTLTITADAASAPVSLTVEGNSALSVTSLASNSTGLTTVDASGLAAQRAGTNSFTLSGTALGTAASTLSVTGTAGDDVVNIGAANVYSATVYGGAGNDALTGGLAADQLHGEHGNDTIIGSGGNDTIRGGEGNDVIDSTAAGVVNIDGGAGNDTVSMADTLLVTDVVNGGEGVDTLAVTTAITGTTGVGVTNFEILSTTVDQNLTNAINNSWTTVLANATGVDVINALSTTNTFQVNQNAQGGAASFTRLTDTGTDSLTLATAGTFNGTLTAFVANDEESITIDVSNGASSVAGSLTIDTLTAGDLTSLTLTGDHSVNITNAVGSTKLATVDATGITASAAPLAANTVSVNASSSTVAVTMTGSTTVANTFTGGVNADSITGGNLADNLTGGNGADTLIGNGGNDVLLGGAGADSINAGAGTDAITAGTQADVVTLTADSQTDTVNQAASDSVAATATAFQGATFAAGDTITFGNGVDVINNFQAGALNLGGDVLNVGTPTSTSLLSSSTGTTTVGWLSGTYANGVFTVAANGIGPDTLVLKGDTLSAATSRAVVLAGVDSDNLVNANFAGASNFQPAYALTVNAVSGAFNPTTDYANAAAAVAAGVQYVTATTGTNTIDASGATNAVTFNFGTGALSGTDVNAAAASLPYLSFNSITGGSGADLITLSTGAESVTGGNGADVLTVATTNTGTWALGAGANVVNIANAGNISAATISATGGSYDLNITGTDSSITVLNTQLSGATNVTESTAGIKTVTVASGALSSYTIQSVIDKLYLANETNSVTLGAAAQSVYGGTGTDTVAVGTTVATGTFSGINTITATSGSIVGVNGGLATGASTLTLLAGDLDLTAVQAEGFSTIQFSGASPRVAGDGLTITGTGVVDFSDQSISGLAGTAAIKDTITLGAGITGLTIDGTDVATTGQLLITGNAGTNALNLASVYTGKIVSASIGNGDLEIDSIETLTFGNFNVNLEASAVLDLTTITGNAGASSAITASSVDGDGNFDLSASAVTGVKTINAEILDAGKLLKLSGETFSGLTSVLGDLTNDDVVLTVMSDATNTSVVEDGFSTLSLGAAGVDVSVGSTFIGNTTASSFTTILGSSGTETFTMTASTASASVNLSAIATATNLEAIYMVDNIGNNTMTVSGTAAVRGITNVSLVNTGTDTVAITDASWSTNAATGATVTSFTSGIGGDKLDLSSNAQSLNGGFEEATSAGTLITAPVNSVLAVNSNLAEMVNVSAANALLIAQMAFEGGGANNKDYAVVIYGNGNAYVWSMIYDTTTEDFDAATLLATIVGVTPDTMASGNFV